MDRPKVRCNRTSTRRPRIRRKSRRWSRYGRKRDGRSRDSGDQRGQPEPAQASPHAARLTRKVEVDVHILLDQGDPSHLRSGNHQGCCKTVRRRPNASSPTAGPGKGATMTAWRSNASIPRISFRVISLQQSGPKNPGVQSRFNFYLDSPNRRKMACGCAGKRFLLRA